MLAEAFLRGRMERVIAGTRVIVSLFALLALWLESRPAGLATEGARDLLVGYGLAALAVFGFASVRVLSPAAVLLIHAADLAAFATLMVLTEGLSSPFFLLFVFSIVSATFRWRWRGVLATAAAVLALFVAVGFYRSAFGPPSPLELDRLVLRCALVAVIGGMLAYFSYDNDRSLADLRRVSAWRPDPLTLDLDGLLRAWMAHVAGVFAVERLALLIDDPEEPWPTVVSWSFGDLTRHQFRAPNGPPPVVASLATAIFLSRHGVGACLALEPSGRIRRYNGPSLDPAFEASLEVHSVLSAPVVAGSMTARLFVLDPPRPSAEDLILAGLVAGQLATALDRMDGANAQREAAAARERLALARDLHDGILQTLAGTALQLEGVARQSHRDPEGVRARIDTMQTWLTGEQREMRRFIRSLEPHNQDRRAADLRRSLRSLCDSLERRWGVRIQLGVIPAALEVPAPLGFHLEQILREAAANAARHGSATSLDITLERRDENLHLSIEDNGRGLVSTTAAGDSGTPAGPRSLRDRAVALGGSMRLAPVQTGLRLEFALPLDGGAGPT